MSTLTSPIIWRSNDNKVTLIDIPQSISAAQGRSGTPFDIQVASCEPLQTPYVTNEPKSAAARAKLANNTVNESLHREYAQILDEALSQIRASHTGDWCLPRFIRPGSISSGRPAKRRRHDQDTGLAPPDNNNDHLPTTETNTPETLPQSLFETLTSTDGLLRQHPDCESACPTCHFPSANFIPNCTPQPRVLDLTPPPSTPPSLPRLSFLIPPNSTLFLSPLSSSRAFHTSVASQTRSHHHHPPSSPSRSPAAHRFDALILDPPWPNRSVRRSHRSQTPGTYALAPDIPSLLETLRAAGLDELMAGDALVAVWITNAPAVRDAVLGAGGLFEGWGLALEEEWVWLKTTAGGEPVSSLGGAWRKPYEVLLLGRKTGKSGGMGAGRRRVLVGVPDLHSRKPCLKGIIEPLTSKGGEARVLEVFARYLVEGWWSWGIECLKFNWDREWRLRDGGGG